MIRQHLKLLTKYIVTEKLNSEGKIKKAFVYLTKIERKKKPLDKDAFYLEIVKWDSSDDDDDDEIKDEDLEEYLDKDDSIKKMKARMKIFQKIEDEGIDLMTEVDELIFKIRDTARFFRKSPLKNDALQVEIEKHLGKKSKLLMDLKIRWNSILFMAKSLVKVQDPLMKVLEDFEPDFVLNESDFELAKEIIQVLDPVFVATKKICQRDANLLTTEIVFKSLISKLEIQESELSKKMAQCIRNRYKERRQGSLVSLLKYLTTGIPKDGEKDPLFKMDSKKQMIATAKKLLKRLFPCDEPTDQSKNSDQNDAAQEIIEEETFEDILEREIQKGTQSVKPTDSVFDQIANDFTYFEANKTMPTNLKLLHQALLSIVPTSVEAERNFSAAGLFLTPHRAGNLSHEMLDNLCILRAFFLKEKNQKK